MVPTKYLTLCLLATLSAVWPVSTFTQKDETFRNTIFSSSSERKVNEHPGTFSHHRVIKPKLYERKLNKELPITYDGNKNSYHPHHLTIRLPLEGQEFVLDLVLNTDFISRDFFRKVQNEIIKPDNVENKLCHYKGKVRNEPDSWVALSTCDGLSGAIFDGREMYHIKKDSSDDNKHFLYQDKNLGNINDNRGYQDPTNTHKIKRDVTQHNKTVRGPFNSDSESKYVELLLVVDNSYYKLLNESTEKVEIYCKDVVNIMNGIYSPLNIFIALVGVVIWTEKDEIPMSYSVDTTLSNFLHYRREKLIFEHPNDNAQLLTGISFENGVLGKGRRSVICMAKYSGGVNTDKSRVVGRVAINIAHTLGHNFGMKYDNELCKCPETRCIMSPTYASELSTKWSSCSINSLKSAFRGGYDHCLLNKPNALYNGPVCGNGFVEDGEECDCGLPDQCKNKCCNAVTCKLDNNAICAAGECCNLRTCNLKKAGTLCRFAERECDLAEYCTGKTEYCPSDVFKMNGESCKNSEGYCYQGDCHTRTDRCKLLWGPTEEDGHDRCYTLNTEGPTRGSCGYNRFNQSRIKCNNEDVYCGMIQCGSTSPGELQRKLDPVPVIWENSVSYNGTILSCRSIGLDHLDSELVPDGSKCGNDKICVKQKCVPISSLSERLTCPHNCYNHGWCNSLGHCHCKPGYIQPHCQFLLPGGSVDSGPAYSYFN